MKYVLNIITYYTQYFCMSNLSLITTIYINNTSDLNYNAKRILQ